MVRRSGGLVKHIVSSDLLLHSCWQKQSERMRWKDCGCIINILLVITYVNVYHNVQAHPKGNQAGSYSVLCVRRWWKRKLLSVMEVQKKKQLFSKFAKSIWGRLLWFSSVSRQELLLCGLGSETTQTSQKQGQSLFISWQQGEREREKKVTMPRWYQFLWV